MSLTQRDLDIAWLEAEVKWRNIEEDFERRWNGQDKAEIHNAERNGGGGGLPGPGGVPAGNNNPNTINGSGGSPGG